jgi:hypothetical protein
MGISEAGPGDVEALRALFREYAAWLGPQGWFSDLEAELEALPEGYVAILLARQYLDRPGARARLPGDAARHAAGDGRGADALPLARLPTDRALQRQPVEGVLFFELAL